MTAVSQARRAALGVPRTRSWRSSVNRGVTREHRIALLLGAVSVLWTALIVVLPSKTPTTALMIPLLFGSLVLGPRILPGFIALLMVCVTVAILVQDTITDRFLNATIVMYLMGLIVFVMSRRRSRLGVGGVRGESMLIDLRDRILTQGTIPQLPPEWDVQSALRSAGGTPFAGDFVVAAKSDADRRLEVAVVDVSGKGEQAGTRALLLSGAFGGLLGTLPPEQFLPAANAYLLHQEWDEGFATAVHMSLDLDTGTFEIRTAGHPPAAHRLAGSGRWQVLRSDGPALGLIDDATFTVSAGALKHGDAVLLYTDGMVEKPRRDIDLGIDRMLGEAEALLRGTFEGAAVRLADALGSPDDDRAMLMVHRR